MQNTLFNRLNYIYKKGYIPFIIRFSKVTIFHITFECLISVYIMELTTILTKFFLVDPTSIPSLIVMVFFPGITVISLSVVFGVFCTLFFANEVYNFSKKIENKNKEYVVYKSIIKIYRKDVIKMHILGLIFYMTTTAVIPWLLVYRYPEKFLRPNAFILCMASIGCLLGIIWNVTGLYRNQRISWHILLPMFAASEKEIVEMNFNCFLRNIIGNIISIIFLVISSVIIICNIHSLLLSDDVFKSLVTDYSFFIISFVALIAYYIKKGFSLLYSVKNKDVVIYPSLNSILGYDETNTETHHQNL